MTPLTALELAPEAAESIEGLAKELAHEFGLTREEDFQGLYLLLIVLYQTVYPTLHNLNVLIKQVQLYVEQLGPSVADAEKQVSKGIGQIPRIHYGNIFGK